MYVYTYIYIYMHMCAYTLSNICIFAILSIILYHIRYLTCPKAPLIAICDMYIYIYIYYHYCCYHHYY